ncbi:uncharacterized protein Fot_27953 [Forsythia ovata]|uniref:Uncharacterized protein n=1 Tax=Forsythia ovata TaxID=205694 RepID=A0ABD1TMN3_9LAMI
MDEGENTAGESSGSNLNPAAKPFRPSVNTPRVERTLIIDHERTLFMSFSGNISRPTQQEIHNYFTGRFGNCIESLYVPELNERDSESGQITFSTSVFPKVIMGDWEEVTLFMSTDKPVRFKKSRRPRRNNN